MMNNPFLRLFAVVVLTVSVILALGCEHHASPTVNLPYCAAPTHGATSWQIDSLNIGARPDTVVVRFVCPKS